MSVSSSDLAAIANSFTYHAPKGDQQKKYVQLRGQAHELAASILHQCPKSRERSIAITKLEESIMWANKSIACNEESDDVPMPKL